MTCIAQELRITCGKYERRDLLAPADTSSSWQISGKRRRLGSPTLRDRVVEAAFELVLEPIFEADFEACSYGFRPRRRAQDAIAEIHHLQRDC
jgi:RNA-directed DNA polymerase